MRFHLTTSSDIVEPYIKLLRHKGFKIERSIVYKPGTYQPNESENFLIEKEIVDTILLESIEDLTKLREFTNKLIIGATVYIGLAGEIEIYDDYRE